MTTLIFKTISPFCYKWQRVRVSSRHSSVELASPSSSSEASSLSPSSSSSSSKSEATRGGGGGEALRAKPPMDAYRRAIQPTQTFTWYNSVECVSRRASMHYSCVMMSPNVTSPVEEEGVERDKAKREGGAAESDCRDLNCASLRLMVA